MKKIILLLGLCLLLVTAILPTYTFAQQEWHDFSNQVSNKVPDYRPLETIPGLTTVGEKVNPADYIRNIFVIGISLAVAVAVLILVWAGFSYVTAEAVNSKADARNQAMSALGGLILALASYFILNIINPELVNINLDLRSRGSHLASQVAIYKNAIDRINSQTKEANNARWARDREIQQLDAEYKRLINLAQEADYNSEYEKKDEYEKQAALLLPDLKKKILVNHELWVKDSHSQMQREILLATNDATQYESSVSRIDSMIKTYESEKQKLVERKYTAEELQKSNDKITVYTTSLNQMKIILETNNSLRGVSNDDKIDEILHRDATTYQFFRGINQKIADLRKTSPEEATQLEEITKKNTEILKKTIEYRKRCPKDYNTNYKAWMQQIGAYVVAPGASMLFSIDTSPTAC